MLSGRKDTCDREAIRCAFPGTFVLTKAVKLPVCQPYKTDTWHSKNDRVYLWKGALLLYEGECQKNTHAAQNKEGSFASANKCDQKLSF